MGHKPNNGMFGGAFKSLVLLVMGVFIMVAGVAYAGRIAIKTWNETGERRRLVYVVEDASGRTVRTIHEVVSPGNAARVTLRGLRRGTYNVTPYDWMAGGAWRSSVPVAERREVSVGMGVEVVEFAIAGSGGGGGGGGSEVAGWPNGLVWMNSTTSPFALPYSMRHPTHTGGVTQAFTFDAVVQPAQAGFNGSISTTALMGWSGTVNMTVTGGTSGVAFGEGVGTMLDPTTRVVEIAVVGNAFVARAMPQATAKRPVRFAELAPGVFVGTVE